MPWSQFTELIVLPVTKKRCWGRFLAVNATMRTQTQDVITMPISPLHIKQYPWGEPCVRRNSGNLSHPKHMTRINFRFLTILPPRRGLKRQGRMFLAVDNHASILGR